MQRLIFIFLTVAIVALVVPAISSAAIELNLDYPRFGNIELDCNKITQAESDAGIQCGQDLSSLIAWLYFLIVGIAGAATFVMIVWGGITYLTSAGNPGQTADAKDRIKKALLGLLLILSSWLILQTINPDLTILKTPGTEETEIKTITAPCDLSSVTCGASFTVNSNWVAPGESVTLMWNLPGFNTCDASSDPNIWSGSKKAGDTEETIVLNELGEHTFWLTCGDGSIIKRVGVRVAAEKPIDDGNPAVADLKVTVPVVQATDNSPAYGYEGDGPLRFIDDIPGNSYVTFTWETAEGNTCHGEDKLIGTSDEEAINGSKIIGFSADPFFRESILIYTITCTNSAGDQKSDSVVICSENSPDGRCPEITPNNN